MSKLQSRAFHAILIGCVAFLLVRPAAAQEEAPENAPPQIAKKADEVLHRVSDFYTGLKSLRVNVISTVHVTAEGTSNDVVTEYDIAMKRPDRLAAILTKGTNGMTVVSDGENVQIYFPLMKRYVVTDSPDTVGELFGPMGAAAMLNMVFAGAFLSDDPYAFMTANATSADYVGKEELDGVTCHHLKLAQPMVDWEMWVDAGEAPLIRKIVPDMAAQLAQDPRFDTTNMTIDFAVDFKNWKVNVDVPDDAFLFTPPEGVEKTEMLFSGAGRGKPHPLLGQQAPEIKLPLLGGGELDLAKHAGKEIVVLDFWATWCGPCRVALPALVDVTATYADKGVVFYAVNEGDEPDQIKEFLKALGVSFTVALDVDRFVGELYQAEAIPQTVIIDRSGIIQAVHVGYAPGVRKRLRKELDTLLAGGSLLKEEQAP